MAALDSGRVIGSCPILETVSVPPSSPCAIPMISGVFFRKCEAHSQMRSSVGSRCSPYACASAQTREPRRTACPSAGTNCSRPQLPERKPPRS
jgi:hypothetical protein